MGKITSACPNRKRLRRDDVAAVCGGTIWSTELCNKITQGHHHSDENYGTAKGSDGGRCPGATDDEGIICRERDRERERRRAREKE